MAEGHNECHAPFPHTTEAINTGPLEATIHNLGKEIEHKTKEGQELQRRWITKQTELVTLQVRISWSLTVLGSSGQSNLWLQAFSSALQGIHSLLPLIAGRSNILMLAGSCEGQENPMGQGHRATVLTPCRCHSRLCIRVAANTFAATSS